MEHQYFDCICDSTEHVIRVSYFQDDRYEDDFATEIYLEVQLSKRVWYKRIWYALKYIFGYECKYGHWDVTSLKRKDAEHLRDLLNKFIDKDAKQP